MAAERPLLLAGWAAAILAAALLGAASGEAPHPQTPGSPASGACTWVPLGPLAVPEGEGYDGSRVPVSGRVTSLALDPGDPATVYLGSALGGVWKSGNQGERWQPLSDREASLAIGALAVDPVRPGVVYAGTGEANLAFRQEIVLADRPLAGHAGRGVLKSTDGGRSWRLLGEPAFSGAAFAELAVSPHAPSLVLAATTRGLFRSLDAGESWARVEAGAPLSGPQAMATSVVFHPERPDVAYAAFWARGVFRCTRVWEAAPSCEQLFGGLPLSNLSRIGLAVSPASADTLFALTATADSSLRGLYVSDDGGSTWKAISGAPDLLQGQGFFNLLIAAPPQRADVLYLGGSGRRQEHPSSLYRASRVNGEWRFVPLGPELHIDLHAMVFDPRDPDTLYVGTDGGLWKTRDGGRTWEARNLGLATLQLTQIDQHPTSSAFLVGGTQDNGTLVYRGGPVWDHGDDGDGGFVVVDPSRPEVVYNEFTLHKIARSEKAGAYGSFVPIYPEVKGARSAFLAPFALDPGDSQVLALGLDRVHRSTDAGRSWTAVTIDLSRGWSSRRRVNAITALLYARSDLIYAGTSDGKVWRLDEVGGVWRATDLSVPGGAPEADRYVADLSVASGQPDILYVAYASGEGPALWRCRTGTGAAACSTIFGVGRGALPPGPVFAIEVDPRAPSVLYAGTEEGVLRSTDGGASWLPFDENLPRTSIFDLQMHRTLPLLRAATHGRGVWERDVSGLPCPSVELYLRDGPLDQGRSSPPSEEAGLSPDLKVVSAAEVPGPLGFVPFARLVENPPRRGLPHRILIQVGNRGSEPAEARVRVFLGRSSAEPLPAGPPQEGAWGAWQLLGEARVGPVAQDLPAIASLDWVPAAPLPDEVVLLAVVDAPADPLAPHQDFSDVLSFVRLHRQAAMRQIRFAISVPI